jgi:hypothetical protein
VSAVNLLLSKKYQKPIKTKIELPVGVTELSSQILYKDWVTDNAYAGRYVIDANAPFIDNPVRELCTETVDQPMLIVPRAGMQHGSHKLYLDSGHWGLPANPAVINAPNSRVMVEHDLHSGKITYKIKETT